MQEQIALTEKLNHFLVEWGLKAVYVAAACDISPQTLYNWKAGKTLLTQRQLNSVREYMKDYEKRNKKENSIMEAEYE